MTTHQLIKQYERRARDEREAGGSIRIDRRLACVAITMSDGSEYFFQDEEASRLLADVPEWINEEDYLLAIAQNW